ncbi:MAG: hypothetical protein LBI27_05155 [Clostridiales bacterium]|nr:hypothetical protein [Clostridiales bacterium]
MHDPHMRELRCARCKEIYTIGEGLPPKYCPKCMAVREEHIKHLYEIITENKGICAMQLQNRSGLPLSLITDLINNGDLSLSVSAP